MQAGLDLRPSAVFSAGIRGIIQEIGRKVIDLEVSQANLERGLAGSPGEGIIMLR